MTTMTHLATIHLNGLDYAIIIAIAASVIISLLRGFVREAMSLTTWVAALWIAFKFTTLLSLQLAPYITQNTLRLILSFAVLFFVTLLLGTFISYLLSQLVNKTGLSGTDRLLGMIFGTARGVLVVTVVFLIANVMGIKQDNTLIAQSYLAPQFTRVAHTLHDMMPDNFQQLGGKRPRLFPQFYRGARNQSALLSRGQAPEIPFVKKAVNKTTNPSQSTNATQT